MKILITGNLGFVGSATQKLLEANGHEVVGYDLMNGQDIRDHKQIDTFVEQVKPDRILHLAAIARFAEADKDPILAHETNIIGTLNVVNSAMKHHIPLVYSSTGSAIMPLDNYEPPYTEDIPARGNSIYGCSKAIAEFYVRKLTPHIVLRYAHIYGAEKRMHGLVGGFIDRIKFGMRPVLYGGKQNNDFVYINDIAQANMKALIAPWDKWNQIYNIGSGEELSAEDAGKIICDIMGYKGKIEIKEGRTVDPARFIFNTKKAELMLGYKAQWKFKDGLKDMMGKLKVNDKK